MDNYVCTLDPTSIKKAKDELNEIPEDRLAAVQAFREWIESQPHIRCPKTGYVNYVNFVKFSINAILYSPALSISWRGYTVALTVTLSPPILCF